jgi:hemolysin activation/secretion protein
MTRLPPDSWCIAFRRFFSDRLKPIHQLLFLALSAGGAFAEPVIQSVRVAHHGSEAIQAESFLKPVIEVSNTLPSSPQLTRKLAPHLGKQATEENLGFLADVVVEHLRQHHWPVSLVSVWDENDGLSQGIVTLQVQQGRVGDIAIMGGTPRRQKKVAQRLVGTAHSPLDSLRLQRRLDALAFSQWLAVESTAAPGATMDTANLLLTLKDEWPFHAFTSYENNGVEPLGDNRYTLGVQWLDAFLLGHDLTLSATVADDPDTLSVLAATWRIPMPWAQEVRLGGYYTESQSTADILGVPLDVSGVTWAASAAYVVPWRLSMSWRSEWSLGYDVKQFDNSFTFGALDSALFDDTVGIGRVFLGSAWFYEKGKSQARLGLEVAHSRESWADGQTAHAFGDLSPGAEPTFTSIRADTFFQHTFAHYVQGIFRLSGQWADGILLPSEELPIASMNAVRGYPERSIRASKGAWANLEARSPVLTTLKHLRVRALAFADGGYIADEAAATDFIASAGVGLRGEITNHLQLRAEIAFPLTEAPDDYRIHLAAVLRF